MSLRLKLEEEAKAEKDELIRLIRRDQAVREAFRRLADYLETELFLTRATGWGPGGTEDRRFRYLGVEDTIRRIERISQEAGHGRHDNRHTGEPG
jgi:hypothetical protein